MYSLNSRHMFAGITVKVTLATFDGIDAAMANTMMSAIGGEIIPDLVGKAQPLLDGFFSDEDALFSQVEQTNSYSSASAPIVTVTIRLTVRTPGVESTLHRILGHALVECHKLADIIAIKEKLDKQSKSSGGLADVLAGLSNIGFRDIMSALSREDLDGARMPGFGLPNPGEPGYAFWS